MTNQELSELYERDLRKLIEEIKLFKTEDDIWKVSGSIKNTSGNLALHIIGSLNFHIGTTLADTGYIRHRELEFTDKRIERKIIVEQLEELIPMIINTLGQLTLEQMESPFPRFFDKENATKSYVLTQMLLHINYHLGQVNYLRRMLE